MEPKGQTSVKFNRISYIFIQENAFENIVWKMMTILCQISLYQNKSQWNMTPKHHSRKSFDQIWWICDKTLWHNVQLEISMLYWATFCQEQVDINTNGHISPTKLQTRHYIPLQIRNGLLMGKQKNTANDMVAFCPQNAIFCSFISDTSPFLTKNCNHLKNHCQNSTNMVTRKLRV